jgi:hypothetical protein
MTKITFGGTTEYAWTWPSADPMYTTPLATAGDDVMAPPVLVLHRGGHAPHGVALAGKA